MHSNGNKTSEVAPRKALLQRAPQRHEAHTEAQQLHTYAHTRHCLHAAPGFRHVVRPIPKAATLARTRAPCTALRSPPTKPPGTEVAS